jgi:hypothetical protein
MYIYYLSGQISLTRHWINVLLYTVTDKDIVFLVPDSCRATVRNSNSIREAFTEDTIKNENKLANKLYIFQQCTYIVFILPYQKDQNNCEID